MAVWVALLRGVNVGGVRLAMADLRAAALGLGWQGARSYIASGNLVFAAEGEAPGLAAALQDALRNSTTLTIPVLVIAAARLRAVVATCPFDPVAGKDVHGFLLWSPAVIDWPLCESLRLASEALVAGDGVVWLHAPEGVGRSKLAERMHRVVTGTQITARNLNTLRALVEMLDAGQAG
ncbi:MAG: DUF1697 domain-containing protein [Rhodobacterales bacterium]|nr:DUF1697 domain-containing protein [Rhodobacterales bacterium]NCT13439.1 DUF1697 domain-containing protein [Rhodobacterales bacterium]